MSDQGWIDIFLFLYRLLFKPLSDQGWINIFLFLYRLLFKPLSDQGWINIFLFLYRLLFKPLSDVKDELIYSYFSIDYSLNLCLLKDEFIYYVNRHFEKCLNSEILLELRAGLVSLPLYILGIISGLFSRLTHPIFQNKTLQLKTEIFPFIFIL